MEGGNLFLVILLTPSPTLLDPLTSSHSPKNCQVCYDKIVQLWTAFGNPLISNRCAEVSRWPHFIVTVPALVPGDDQHPALWKMDTDDVHTCSINIYGESTRRPLDENCLALKLRGRVSWFIIRTEVIGDLILCEHCFFFPPFFSQHAINFLKVTSRLRSPRRVPARVSAGMFPMRSELLLPRCD